MTTPKEPQYRYEILPENGSLLKNLTEEEVVAKCLTGEIDSTAMANRVKVGAWVSTSRFKPILDFPEFAGHIHGSPSSESSVRAPVGDSIGDSVIASVPRGAAVAALTRYRDGYLVASTIDGIGRAIKVVGIIIGVFIALLGIFLATQTNAVVGVYIIIGGLITGAPLFVLGVVVSAQAQMTKAMLDTAVHSSPFLDESAKASAMSLRYKA